VSLKRYVSSLFRKWAQELEKPPKKESFLNKKIPLPKWALTGVVFLCLVVAILMEVGISKKHFLFAFLFSGIWSFYTTLYFEIDTEIRESQFFLIVLMFIFFILGTQFIISKNSTMFLLITPAVVSIVKFLVTKRAALFTTIATSLIASVLYQMDFSVFFISFASGIGALAFPHKVIKRSDIFLNGISIFVFMLVGVLCLHLFGVRQNVFFIIDIQNTIFTSLGAAIFVMAFLPVFEGLLGLTSDIRLVELGDFNRPLLKRLMEEAPGTYHHSLMVATLSEAAATAIGANGLLARVGAYYHDIGKIKKPQYFVENQTSENRHEKLKPEMSALIILSHVKEGILLANQYGLDECIKDFISQHHGTSVIQYFYKKASNSSPQDESTYRYPGPLPQTKETAIVMLADSVEAATRALDEPDYERIREVVNKIINNYFVTGQLNECPITLKNLQKISEVFTKTIMSIHHTRIEYPDSK